ncbi:flagellar biosynthetic protein FlhF [Desulfitobacterium dehalogenans ATCC 51507]|uniref:Flagellar biosynthesis protein FlhF n=1 Tax=Desulfitobacterium dehalogenans (strain ATCC 51507 / DSM 9161 / JW/IU-DC1) TaxID=756499 RepID=U3GKZ1_DESDJ|nr:flagellar biosynthesis protein FlhF [Desulfitobacterium dehalogenans]AFM01791.1 flagellar biosynthetic protein FlhF [Desulfitobacterium dehalogenans ATCC 51507]
MRVKRFVGDTVAETMGKVKKELGADAVILQTRQFKEGGLLGLFGKPKVEVMAAIEEEPVNKKQVPVKSLYPSNPYTVRKEAPLAHNEEKEIYPHRFVESIPTERTPRVEVSTLKNGEVNTLEVELQSMRKLLESMNRQIEGLDGEQGVWPVPLQKWADMLKERGINPKLIKRLLRSVQQNVREEDWVEDHRVRSCIKEAVRQICGNTAAIQPGVRKPRIVALVGPTGVGKTTTIGKLAAGFSIVDKRRVALITADTYRVAAVEQLKTFGEIIGVPVEVVMTPSGLREAIQRHEDKELIFIDTAGRSPHHDLHMSELKAFLEKAQPELTMLVMSAATQAPDLAKIYERFEALTTHLIFTKMDETISGGTILNLLERTDLPVAYITNGQNVPDDIEVATPERLTRYILGEGDRRE